MQLQPAAWNQEGARHPTGRQTHNPLTGAERATDQLRVRHGALPHIDYSFNARIARVDERHGNRLPKLVS
jgi:hypothetical protein